jgi:DNA (cytosine-5)-methyltransferase 1
MVSIMNDKDVVMSEEDLPRVRAAEFFAGMGLVRAALEPAGFEVVFANDIEPVKQMLYSANFEDDDFRLGDVRDVNGGDVPDVDLASASFPCTDLSLAGNRAGLKGAESSMFWEFARVLDEMGGRRPQAVLLENVLGFATSHGGGDLEAAVMELNRLGYSCDVFVGDARWFVPQSRPRMFVVGLIDPPHNAEAWGPSVIRPEWVWRFKFEHPDARMHAYPFAVPLAEAPRLSTMVERLVPDDERWWDVERAEKFIGSLSSIQQERLVSMMASEELQWRTACRRTRAGVAVWEIRSDEIAGCLRTARGGSSKQAVVEAGRDEVRVRWMTPREYSRLQGAGDFALSSVTPNQALFGLGDGVCVPVIRWIADSYLGPVLRGLIDTTTAYA